MKSLIALNFSTFTNQFLVIHDKKIIDDLSFF